MVKNNSTSHHQKTKSLAKKVIDKVVKDNENGARHAVIEDLFYDFHRHRFQVYGMNFWRGLFFGFGSALGATILIAVLIWLTGQLVDIFPALADFMNTLNDTMQRRR